MVSEHHNLAQDITFHLIFWSICWALVVAFYLFMEIIKCIWREGGGGENDPCLVCVAVLPLFIKPVCCNIFLSVWSPYGLLTNHYIMKQESVSLPERRNRRTYVNSLILPGKGIWDVCRKIYRKTSAVMGIFSRVCLTFCPTFHWMLARPPCLLAVAVNLKHGYDRGISSSCFTQSFPSASPPIPGVNTLYWSSYCRKEPKCSE